MIKGPWLFRIGLASFLVLDKRGERFRNLIVIFAPGIVSERFTGFFVGGYARRPRFVKFFHVSG